MTRARTLADMISDGVIGTTELADDAITPVKLDETGSYAMAGLTVDTNTLHVDSANNRVGFGTTNPARSVTIFGDDQPVFQITNNTSGTANTRGLIQYIANGTTDAVFDNQGSGSGGTFRFMQAGTERLRMATSAFVANEGGNDYDFRVESDGNTHMLFVDASENAVAIGSASTSTAARLRAAASTVASGDSIVLIDSANDANVAGNHLHIKSLRGDTSAYNLLTVDNVAGGILNISGNGSTVFNEAGLDRDFRIESDSNEYAFVVDASESKVKINTASGGVYNTKNFIVGDGLVDQNQYSTGDWEKIALFLPNTTGAGSEAAVVIGGASYGGSGTETLRLQFANTHGNQGRPVGWNIRSYTNTDANNFNQSLLFDKVTRSASGNPTISSVFELNSYDTVFNQYSYDRDFRVESDNRTHTLFVDAGNDRIGINDSAPGSRVSIVGGDGTNSTLEISGSNNDVSKNDNATISAPFSIVAQVNNQTAGNQTGRTFSIRDGGKGYSDGTQVAAFGIDGSSVNSNLLISGSSLATNIIGTELDVYNGGNQYWVKIFHRYFRAGSGFDHAFFRLDFSHNGATNNAYAFGSIAVSTKQQGSTDQATARLFNSYNNTNRVAWLYSSSGGDESAGLMEIWIKPPTTYCRTSVHAFLNSEYGGNGIVGIPQATSTGDTNQPAGSSILTAQSTA